jgi:thiamine pyrophosphate-dependent acetolactate synthase large subunit-like protein
MTKTTQNKPTRKDLDQKVMDGVDAHLASVPTLTINGEQFTPATLKAVFQSDIDAMDKTDATRAQLKAEVQVAKAARLRATVVRKALKAFLIGQFGPGAVQLLQDFGFTVPKAPGPKTTKLKAAATAKGVATKARVRTAVKQAKAETPEPATPPPPTPPATTPTKS